MQMSRFPCIAVLMVASLMLLFATHIRSGPQRQPTLFEAEDSETERFMTYFPHSGLHNQRISLINAMVIAKYLNRTLVMPEINIGRSIYWRPSLHLERRLNDCTQRKPNRTRCFDFSRYVPVSVATILDLSSLKEVGIRTLQRQDMRLEYFERFHDAQADDIYTLDDWSRYTYRFFDKKDGDPDLLNFEQRINLSDLKHRQERFMAFGSLFGSDRLHLETEEFQWLQHYLLSEVSINHPVVMNQALNLVSRLGGPGKFASAHLRLGDGFFKDQINSSMNEIRSGLHKDLPDEPDLSTLQRLRTIATDKKRIPELLQECLVINDSHPQLQIIYLATDAQQPRISLPQLFDEFVCLFSLADFPEVIQGTLTASPFNPNAGKQYPSRLGPLLLPLIDAEIAAHASYFVGTSKSTFTKYIGYRNTRLRNYYPQMTT